MEELLKQILSKLEEQTEQLSKQGEQLDEQATQISEINKAVARIENEHVEKLSALFDAREVSLDREERIESTLLRLETKVEKFSLQLAKQGITLKYAK